jgi:hypothetical protein
MEGIRQDRAADSPRWKEKESYLMLENLETKLQREEQLISELECFFLAVTRMELGAKGNSFDILNW